MPKNKFLSFLMIIGIAMTSVVPTTSAQEFDEINDDQISCSYILPDKTNYDAIVISVRKKLRVEPGEVTEGKVFVKNESNVPWFSGESDCKGPKVFLGTENERDHSSVFFSPNVEGVEDTGWESATRIKMDQERVDPGKIASFTFSIKAANHVDVLKEYFRPVVEGVAWMEGEDALVSTELIIGNHGESPVNLRKKLFLAAVAGSVKDIDLNAEKMLLVDLSEQRVYLKLGGKVVRSFQVSSGAARTPTPVGETRITEKNEVRIGSAPPHYIMPKFMMFRAGGYGFHALPSLANDGGVFWTEALNHLGVPVSHGCIRLAPQDADFLFDFAEIGTLVKVQW